MNDNDHLAYLQGRIIALELMVRGYVTMTAMDQADPLQFVEDWRREMLASFQHLSRPIDDESDEIWRHAIDALNMLFDEAQKRVQHLS